MKTYSKEQLIDAAEIYYKEVAEDPEKFTPLDEIVDTRVAAELYVEKLLQIADGLCTQ